MQYRSIREEAPEYNMYRICSLIVFFTVTAISFPEYSGVTDAALI
jgi:hypothetical protein